MTTIDGLTVDPRSSVRHDDPEVAAPVADPNGCSSAPANPIVGRVIRVAPEPDASVLGRVTREGAGQGLRAFGCVVREAPDPGVSVLGRVVREAPERGAKAGERATGLAA